MRSLCLCGPSWPYTSPAPSVQQRLFPKDARHQPVDSGLALTFHRSCCMFLNQLEPTFCRFPINSIYGFILGTCKTVGSGWLRFAKPQAGSGTKRHAARDVPKRCNGRPEPSTPWGSKELLDMYLRPQSRLGMIYILGALRTHGVSKTLGPFFRIVAY